MQHMHEGALFLMNRQFYECKKTFLELDTIFFLDCWQFEKQSKSNTNPKFDLSKAKMATQLQLFSTHSYHSTALY
jgi:hypothetical protein